MLQVGKVLALVFLLGMSVIAEAALDWSLARDRDGIKVWTRDVPGFPVKEFKAVTQIHSTLNGLVALIMDTDNAKKWIYRTEKIDLLKRDDAEGYFLIHVITNFPWPLTDRDAYVEGSITQDKKTGIVTIKSQALPLSKHPAEGKWVRMTQMTGTWLMKPLGHGEVEVTMIGLADPAGSLPSGAVNLLIHETPYRTLQGMRSAVSAAVYQQVRASQIQEK